MRANTDNSNIQKCDFEAGASDEQDNTTWAVDVPADTNVRVQLVVRAGTDSEVVGGANITGRYELTLKEADPR